MGLDITSTANAIKVDFDDESSKVGMDKGTWLKSVVEEVHLRNDHVEIITSHGIRLSLVQVANGSQTMLVDTVDTVAPSSLSDLYDKISALIE